MPAGFFGKLPAKRDFVASGASSLPYLLRLIVGYVKIDGAYVRGINDRLRERAIIEGVLATCRSLGVLTVATGAVALQCAEAAIE